MATHIFTTATAPPQAEAFHAAVCRVARVTWAALVGRGPNANLLTACRQSGHMDRALTAAADDEDDSAAAWEARSRLLGRLATMRPGTDAGRRAKAAVAIILLLETSNWERTSEWEFALAAFRTEALV